MKRHPRATPGKRAAAKLGRAARADSDRQYVLRLYVAGLTPRSTAAIESVKQVCEEHLRGRYRLDIIDIYHDPTLARGEQIIAAPTLIKKLPVPLRRLIGDMSDREKLLVGLDLRPKGARGDRAARP